MSNYHHGDLRNALIAASVEMLQEEGMEALSLRKIARKIGVSHNAPYMHFADKDALLAVIAAEGFDLLAAHIRQAKQHIQEGWFERFKHGCFAYVDFILNHTGHAQVMFRDYDGEKYPDTIRAAVEALGLLEEVIVEGQQNGMIKEGDSLELTTVTWSMLHGIATILSTGKMPPLIMDQHTPQTLTSHFLELFYAGLKPL